MSVFRRRGKNLPATGQEFALMVDCKFCGQPAFTGMSGHGTGRPTVNAPNINVLCQWCVTRSDYASTDLYWANKDQRFIVRFETSVAEVDSGVRPGAAADADSPFPSWMRSWLKGAGEREDAARERYFDRVTRPVRPPEPNESITFHLKATDPEPDSR